MEITFDELKKDLPSKEISVEDLTKFLANRIDTTPNYSLLLGAGSSVTSGIRAASQLISEWKKEVFLKKYPNDQVSPEAIDNYFKSPAVLSWYDARNEYSCLFEKQYNLPKHRRAFVEREVDGKNPSLGYAYLMKIIKKRFINTIFTTNFDDLINEAFYQYSDERPIVCAHDSAINSITITGDRPKIVKLHGDYLFDDIKSTKRETESLEENMKAKFIEFAKDSGLIVAGYAGNDRSIMDVIFRLLNDRRYFTHGIYWCLRSDSIINGELRKLFWDERVFFVQIDGFDELMAKLNDKLNDSLLPIDTYARSNNTIETINNLIEDKYIKNSNSPIIKRDLQILERQLQVNELGVALDVLSDDKIYNQDQNKKETTLQSHLTRENRAFLRAISALIHTQGFLEALDKINFRLEKQNNSTEFKKELFSLKATIHLELGDKRSALRCFHEQSELSPKSVIPLLNLSNFSDSYVEKIYFLNKAIKIDPYDHVLLESKARLLREQYNNISADQAVEKESDLLATIQKGITVEPGIHNKCYQTLFKHYLLKQDAEDTNYSKCSEIIESLEKQNPYHPIVANLNIKLLLKKHEAPDGIHYTNTEAIREYINTFEENVIEEYLPPFLIRKLYCYQMLRDKENSLKTIEQFESAYKPTAKYITEKAQALFLACKDLNKAIDTLENALLKHKNSGLESQYVDYLVYNEEFERAQAAIKAFPEISDASLEKYYCAIGNLDHAIELCQKRYQDFPESPAGLSALSFLYLKKQMYKEAETILQKKLTLDFHNRLALTVNYQLARIGLEKEVQPAKLKPFRKDEKKNLGQAAICCLLGKKDLAINIIKECIEADYESYFTVKHWLVFDPLKDNKKFKQLLETPISSS